MRAGKHKSTRVRILGIGVLGALLMLAVDGPDTQFWRDRIAALGNTPTNAVTSSQVPTESTNFILPEIKGNAEDETSSMQFNEMGVSRVLQKDYWQGLYYFEQAIRRDPTRIVPIINMAEVLTELGLTRPAKRYLEMATALNPDHPWLKENSMTTPAVGIENSLAEIPSATGRYSLRESLSGTAMTR